MAVSDSSIYIRNGLSYTLGHGRGVDSEITEDMFYDPQDPIVKTRKNLPHWDQTGKIIFVTFRLADSIPQVCLRAAAWIRNYILNESAKGNWKNANEAIKKYDRLLDQGMGQCILANDEIRQIVVDSLLYGDGTSYELYHFVVMPNHVHLLIRPLSPLVKVMQNILSFSSHAINRATGLTGKVWLSEPFDHIIRSREQFAAKRDYIGNNPRFLA